MPKLESDCSAQKSRCLRLRLRGVLLLQEDSKITEEILARHEEAPPKVGTTLRSRLPLTNLRHGSRAPLVSFLTPTRDQDLWR